MKLLVVEDNDSNYMLVRHILKNYNFVRALNGAETAEKVSNGDFGFVLTNLRMPVMEEQRLRKRSGKPNREADPDIHTVALTADAFHSHRVSAIEAGCNVFIAKPVKHRQLIELFSNYNKQ